MDKERGYNNALQQFSLLIKSDFLFKGMFIRNALLHITCANATEMTQRNAGEGTEFHRENKIHYQIIIHMSSKSLWFSVMPLCSDGYRNSV